MITLSPEELITTLEAQNLPAAQRLVRALKIAEGILDLAQAVRKGVERPDPAEAEALERALNRFLVRVDGYGALPRRVLAGALDLSQGNTSKAAELCGCSVRTAVDQRRVMRGQS